MSASKLYPKFYQGREESGGYIAENTSRKSDTSPHYRGRIYLPGVGWFWVSGWTRNSRNGEMIALSLKGLTDKEAEQYCAPKSGRGHSNNRDESRSTYTNPNDSASAYPEQVADGSDIPF